MNHNLSFLDDVIIPGSIIIAFFVVSEYSNEQLQARVPMGKDSIQISLSIVLNSV